MSSNKSSAEKDSIKISPVGLMDQIDKSRGWQAKQCLRQIDSSHKLMYANARELLIFLSKHDVPEKVEPIYVHDNRDKMQDEFDEAARLIHNFVAATKSAVDNSRNLIKKAFDGDAIALKTYELEVERRFVKDPLCQFVQGLRNYCVHRAIPVVIAQWKLDESGNSDTSMILDKNCLLPWDGWNTAAKAFLAESPSRINFQQVVNQYCEKLESFREWIGGLFDMKFKSDFEELYKLQRALESIVREDMQKAGN